MHCKRIAFLVQYEKGGDGMPDYQKMYLTLFHATENAIEHLIEAQKKCEEIYVSTDEPELTVLNVRKEKSHSKSE